MVGMLVCQSMVGIDGGRKHQSDNKVRQSDNGKCNRFAISSGQGNETLRAR